MRNEQRRHPVKRINSKMKIEGEKTPTEEGQPRSNLDETQMLPIGSLDLPE